MCMRCHLHATADTYQKGSFRVTSVICVNLPMNGRGPWRIVGHGDASIVSSVPALTPLFSTWLVRDLIMWVFMLPSVWWFINCWTIFKFSCQKISTYFVYHQNTTITIVIYDFKFLNLYSEFNRPTKY